MSFLADRNRFDVTSKVDSNAIKKLTVGLLDLTLFPSDEQNPGAPLHPSQASVDIHLESPIQTLRSSESKPSQSYLMNKRSRRIRKLRH